MINNIDKLFNNNLIVKKDYNKIAISIIFIKFIKFDIKTMIIYKYIICINKRDTLT